jgi:hypothetical protein
LRARVGQLEEENQRLRDEKVTMFRQAQADRTRADMATKENIENRLRNGHQPVFTG